MFSIGDYVVCPGHGVGKVSSIEERELDESRISFYKVTVISNGMTIMVPTSGRNGIRKLVDDGEVEDIYDVLNNHDITIDTSTWNRRHREYMAKVNTGSPFEIAKVLRSLFLLKKRKKNLSFGEKKMLNQCKDLLAQEMSITEGSLPQAIKQKIDSCFDNEA